MAINNSLNTGTLSNVTAASADTLMALDVSAGNAVGKTTVSDIAALNGGGSMDVKSAVMFAKYDGTTQTLVRSKYVSSVTYNGAGVYTFNLTLTMTGNELMTVLLASGTTMTAISVTSDVNYIQVTEIYTSSDLVVYIFAYGEVAA